MPLLAVKLTAWLVGALPSQAERTPPATLATPNRPSGRPISNGSGAENRVPTESPRAARTDGPGKRDQIGTMSGAPSRAASAVRSSGCRCDSRSASTRFS